MNQAEQTHIWKVVERAKKCLLGKISEDIESRLPKKPEQLSAWEKYKLIKDGKATLIKTMTVKQLMDKYNSVSLIEAFTYPERDEVKEYLAAYGAVKKEKEDREMAVETSFNRLADERIMGLIDAKAFLDSVEKMQQDKW